MLLLQMQTWIVSYFKAKWQAINRTRSSWVSEHDLASKVIFPDCCTCPGVICVRNSVPL